MTNSQSHLDQVIYIAICKYSVKFFLKIVHTFLNINIDHSESALSNDKGTK